MYSAKSSTLFTVKALIYALCGAHQDFKKVQIHLSTKSGEVLEGRDAAQTEVTVFCHLGGSGLLRKAGG
jgi:hypothetical protein